MTETGAKPGRRRLWKYALLFAFVGMVLATAATWYMTTNSFQALVHRRLVAELERITGGRVELGSLHTSPFRVRVEIRDLTIHGRESADDVPYAHVDRLVAQIKIISLLATRFGFDSIVFDRPVFHIIFYPDGSTNQPQPHLKRSETTPIEQLFSLSINNLQVRRGEVLWGDQRVPLDFVVHDVSADMTYSLFRQRYETNILLGKADTTVNGYRPVAWTAEAHFSLGRNSVEVKSLKATSGRSRVEVSGRVKNFHKPQVEGDYDVSLDLAEAAAVARRPDLRRGVLRGTGRGAWSAQDFSSAGQVTLTDFDWRSLPVGLHDASLNAHFTIDPQRISLTQVQGRVFGGSVIGEAEVIAWQIPPKAPKGTKNSELQRGKASFRLKDLSAGEIAAALSTPARPFHRVNLAAAASGTLDARWKGTPANAEVAIVVDLVPPAHPLAHQLPVSGRIRGTYRGAAGELELAELTASTPGTQVHASGTLSSSAALKLSVTTRNLGEWQPILTAVGYKEPLPITLHGNASFAGTATGRLTDIAFAGALESQEFDVLVPASSQLPARQLHWDSLVTDVHLSPHNFAARNGRLLRDHTAINFDFRTSLTQRQFTDSSSFRVRVDTQDADLAGVLALAGFSYPASGTLNLHLRATGTRAEPHGEGHVQLTKAVLYGEPIDRFDAGLVLNGQEVQLNNISVTQSNARVAGDTAYNFSTHGLRFQLTGNNFDLSRVAGFDSRLTAEGNLDFTANGSGTLEEPSVQAAIQVRDLTLDHERAGNFSLHAASNGSEVHLTGQSEFEHASLQLDGNVHLRGDWPASISLHFEHLDVDSVLRVYLRGHVTGHSAVAGDLHVDGPLRTPRELQVAGSLSDFFVDVENVKLRNQGSVRFSVSRQALQIEQFHLLGEDTDLSVKGTVQLAGRRPMELQAQGRVNLRLIESFNPDFTSSGVVTMDVKISGGADKPLTNGRVRIENGNIAYSDLPTGLSDINGSLVFSQDRLQIETLTAHTGGGLVTLSGYATSYDRQISFNLTAHGQGVRLRYPPGVSSTADLDLNFAGSPAASTLSGNVTVYKLGMTPGFDFGAYLARSAQTSALPPTNPLLNSIRLDIHAVTAPDLQMQTAVVRLSGDADVRVRGTAAKPVILGRADIIEGEVYFNGTKYRLERGDVSFTNPVSTTPVLDLQASTRIRDYDITLNLNGPIDKPNLTYRSEPPLPTGDIVALLAFGQTTEESAQLQQSNQSAFGQAASSALLNAALNATVSNRVQRLFGVSRIKIDPQGLTTETSPTQTGPAVTIEQQVKSNLTITYTTNVSQASQQIIQAEYNVTRNVSIVGVRDQNGVVSFDVRIRQRKK